MPYAVSGNTRIYFKTHGPEDAPALVLHRGLARSMRYWLGLDERLAERYRVVCIDHRGVGRSDAPNSGYSTKQMADDVAAVLDAARLDRAHFFGMSLGGMAAQWFALRHGPRLDRLILGATTPGGPSSHGIPLRVRWGLARCAGLPLRESIKRTARFTLANKRDEVVARWIKIAESEPTHQRGIIGQAWSGMWHHSLPHLAGITHPTLIVTGDQDALIPYQNSVTLARLIPNSTIHILDGAGHDFAAERPDETLRLIDSFLSAGTSE